MDLTDPLSPPISIVHRSQEVFQATSRAIVYRFLLVFLPLLIHVKGSTGVYRLWAWPYFSSSVQHVWFVSLGYFSWWVVGSRIAAVLLGVASRICSILLTAFLCNCQAFSPYILLASMLCIHIAVSTWLLLGRNCIYFISQVWLSYDFHSCPWLCKSQVDETLLPR